METQREVGWCATSEKNDTVIALAREPALTTVKPTMLSATAAEMYGLVNVLGPEFDATFTLSSLICINLHLPVIQVDT